MRILIGQPKMEQHLEQFIQEIEANPDVDLILYPEGYLSIHTFERGQGAREDVSDSGRDGLSERAERGPGSHHR